MGLDGRDACNAVRFVQGDDRGHYESYFLRANHPEHQKQRAGSMNALSDA